ncbi:MAG TPA: type I-E CRISPR-associated protein Cse1/CasA [Anaerolineaceae bacterium]|nr:type I-E CRISPR-associated protein Cse1/CasA [Anaerolineaceae bacterium]
MTCSYNLIDRNWIPCVRMDGRLEDLSLRETLRQAQDLRGLQGDSPLETAAIYRMLLAMLHSALRGPRSQSEWVRLWDCGYWQPDLINGYLEKWSSRFDLFDPDRPFYQAADARVKPKSTVSLVLDMASGNNASLFDHHTEAVGAILSPAKAARTLLVAQSFSLAGLSGLEQKFTDGPWGRGVIFLVEGQTLFQTLCLNLLRYPHETVLPSQPDDRPAWENEDPYLPARQIPRGYLDYLTWQNRRILLIPEGDGASPMVSEMTMAPGLRLDASIRDPMKLFLASKKEEGYFCMRFSEDRALWRDSASLFGLKGSHGNRPPINFHWIAELAEKGSLPQEQVYRFMALGMANDQAKIEFFCEEHMPMPLEYLERDDLLEQLAASLELAEQTRFWLKAAAQWLALLVISPKSDGKRWQEVDRISRDQAEKLTVHWNVERFYWQQLEIPFFQFLEDLPEHPEALQTWKESLRKAAWAALEQAAEFAGTDAAALKASVCARGSLGASLKQLFPDVQKEEASL